MALRSLRRTAAASSGRTPDKPRIGDARTPRGRVRRPFAGSLPRISRLNTLSAADDRALRPLSAQRKFLGMFGPQGALPLTTTEEAYGWLRERDDAFPRFVDIFQRRFLALFFRAWADARPVAQNDRPAEDRFRDFHRLDDRYRDARAVGTRTRSRISPSWNMRGCSRRKVKSASRLRTFLSCLLRTRVEIDEFVGAWLDVRSSERTRLGGRTRRLGGDCIARREHVQRQRQVPRPRLRARHRAFRAVLARLADGASRSPTRCSSTSERNTIGTWSSPFPPARSRRCASARRSARLDELDVAELVEGRRDNPRRRAISCGQPLAARSAQASRSELRSGAKHGRGHQRRIGRRQAQRVGYEAFIQALRQAKTAGQPQYRACALAARISCRRTEPTSRFSADHFKLDRAKHDR